MPCSAVTLSLGTICAVAAAALLGIAFGTDNWQYFRVSKDLEGFPPREFNPDINALYLNRTQGLFRICFLGEKPDMTKVPTYISPVETNCMNIEYHIGELTRSLEGLSEYERARLYMLRTCASLFIVSFIVLFVSFIVGLTGCWKRSPAKIGFTAMALLFACAFAAGGMGLWHGVDYYEREKISVMPYRGGWDHVLQENTTYVLDWSYFIAWIGVGCEVLATILFCGAYFCMKRELRREVQRTCAYYGPPAVYQQKQQYAGYGYGYPGPYQYNSQQYGHYNY